MVALNEDNIENFIRENKDKFGVYLPPEGHLDKFFLKLNLRIKHLISIVPYLIRVAVGTVIIFVASLIIWNNYIRSDRNEISITDKVKLIVNKINTYENTSKRSVNQEKF